MAKGRKKTSDRIKEIKGTNQPVRMSGDGTLVDPVSKLPSCPKWLNAPARKMYRSFGQSLMVSGILNELNISAFSMLCNETGKYVEFQNELNSEGYVHSFYDEKKGASIYSANPKVKLASDAFKNAKAMMVEFGMTPAALARIASLINKKSDSDDYEDYLNG